MIIKEEEAAHSQDREPCLQHFGGKKKETKKREMASFAPGGETGCRCPNCSLKSYNDKKGGGDQKETAVVQEQRTSSLSMMQKGPATCGKAPPKEEAQGGPRTLACGGGKKFGRADEKEPPHCTRKESGEGKPLKGRVEKGSTTPRKRGRGGNGKRRYRENRLKGPRTRRSLSRGGTEFLRIKATATKPAPTKVQTDVPTDPEGVSCWKKRLPRY